MHGRKNLKNVEDCNVTYILLMNKENCALKLVDETILYLYMYLFIFTFSGSSIYLRNKL